MATVMEHTYHLKGGEEEAVERNNPLLDRREPIVVFMKDGSTRMKIGDGKHRYNDLPWMGEKELCSRKTRVQFPNVGREDVLYKAEEEHLLYQWNTEKLIYEVLGLADSEDILYPAEINGGTAASLLHNK